METAKKKAQELVDKFFLSESCHTKHYPNNNYCDCESMNTVEGNFALNCGTSILICHGNFDYIKL